MNSVGAKATYYNWFHEEEPETSPAAIPDTQADKVEILYDHGKMYVYINDLEVYRNTSFGINASVIIKRT